MIVITDEAGEDACTERMEALEVMMTEAEDATTDILADSEFLVENTI